MPGKRKRGGGVIVDNENSDLMKANGKPISAVAAARLRAGTGATVTIASGDGTQEEVSAPAPLIESSASDHVESELEEELPIIHRNYKLCNWRNDGKNVLSESDEGITIALHKHFTISLIGHFDFQVLKGAVNVNGANIGAITRQGLKHQINRAFVPSIQPISKIRGLDGYNEVQFLHCEEPTPFSSISPLFANIWNASSIGETKSFSLITDSDADSLRRSIIPELIPDDWIRVIEDCASRPSITLVTGVSGSGKSTFARRLLNRHLTGLGKTAAPSSAVCYMDLDSNKPEYSPHGQISLVTVREINIGPSFTHTSTVPATKELNEIVRAYPLPLASPIDFSDYFDSCVDVFLKEYKCLRQQNPSLPLIIDAPGLLYTSHFSTLLRLLSRVKLDYLIHLGNNESIEPQAVTSVHSLQIAVSRNHTTMHEISNQESLIKPCRTDSELRDMQMMSYFHCIGLKNETNGAGITTPQRIWDSKSLSAMTPWELCYDENLSRKQDFVGFLMLSEWVEPSQILTALNGSIVHILESTDENILQLLTPPLRTNKFRIPYFHKGTNGRVEPVDPRKSRLVCTALIRGWDPDNRVVQVLVPRTHEQLLHSLAPERSVIVGGCCDSPEWAYMEDSYCEMNKRMVGNQGQSSTPRSNAILEDMQLPPWVTKGDTVDAMGYLDTVRRVRKFHQ